MKISREHPHYKMPFEQRLEGGEGGSHVDIQVTVFQAGGKPLPGLVQWENAWCSWTSSGTVLCKWWEWGWEFQEVRAWSRCQGTRSRRSHWSLEVSVRTGTLLFTLRVIGNHWGVLSRGEQCSHRAINIFFQCFFLLWYKSHKTYYFKHIWLYASVALWFALWYNSHHHASPKFLAFLNWNSVPIKH